MPISFRRMTRDTESSRPRSPFVNKLSGGSVLGASATRPSASNSGEKPNFQKSKGTFLPNSPSKPAVRIGKSGSGSVNSNAMRLQGGSSIGGKKPDFLAQQLNQHADARLKNLPELATGWMKSLSLSIQKETKLLGSWFNSGGSLYTLLAEVKNKDQGNTANAIWYQPVPPDPMQYIEYLNADQRYVDNVGLIDVGEPDPMPVDHSLIYRIVLGFFQTAADKSLDTLARRAWVAGNDDAAANILWFLHSGPSPRNDYPVDKMLKELDVWRKIIDENNQTSLIGFVGNTDYLKYQDENYEVYVNETTRWIDTDNDGRVDKAAWWRVGQEPPGNGRPSDSSSTKNIYVREDLEGKRFIQVGPSQVDFQYLMGGQPTDFTREQFDWFIAMNAFDYSVSQVVVVDKNTGDATLTYQVQVADEYQWYDKPPATGQIDAIMGTVDSIGTGEGFAIRGVSSVMVKTFNINSDLKVMVDADDKETKYYELHDSDGI